MAGGLSAGASIFSAKTQADAAKTASNQQAQAQALALGQQKQMFGTAQTALNPFIDSGSGMLPTLSGLLTPGASQTDILKTLPGFQFQSEWGTRAATNALAARGLGGSTGPVAKAVSDYNSGLAGTSFGTLVNALQGYANMGTSAAGALAGDAITSGNNQATTQGAIGTAQAAGTLGSANALAGGVTGAANSAGNALLLSKLLPNSSSPSGTSAFYNTPNLNDMTPASFGVGG